ncbi:MAG: hypothetical protein KF861_10770 [Planctomycetaceae bacterium]|nr:hypothetical protein [Planctomycetaceae bacterium]
MGDDEAQQPSSEDESCAGGETQSQVDTHLLSRAKRCPAVNYGEISGVWWYDVWKNTNCFGGTIDGVPHNEEVTVCTGLGGTCNAAIPTKAPRAAYERRDPIQKVKSDPHASFSQKPPPQGTTHNVELLGCAKLRYADSKTAYFLLFTITHKRGNGPLTIRHCGVQCKQPQNPCRIARINSELGSKSDYEHYIDVTFEDGDAEFDVTFHVTSVDDIPINE